MLRLDLTESAEIELEQAINQVLDRVNPDPAIWENLNDRFRCDVVCGLAEDARTGAANGARSRRGGPVATRRGAWPPLNGERSAVGPWRGAGLDAPDGRHALRGQPPRPIDVRRRVRGAADRFVGRVLCASLARDAH